MDDLEKLYRARITTQEMLTDRGYIIKENVKVDNLDTFRKLFYSKNIDFLVETEGKISIYVRWIITPKIKPNFIKDTIELIREQLNEKGIVAKLLIISKAKPNTNVMKIIKEKEYRGTELFWLNNLVFNITKHILVPKHTVIDEDEVKKILNELFITNKFSLPIMLKTDPVAKYFDLSTGDVCKIIRNSPNCGQYITYRVVK